MRQTMRKQQQSQIGRMLRPDPAGDILLFPLRPEGPLRYRELTAYEAWEWHQQCEVVLSGGAWTSEVAAHCREMYQNCGQEAHR